jgi:hypothetical protein
MQMQVSISRRPQGDGYRKDTREHASQDVIFLERKEFILWQLFHGKEVKNVH